MTATHHALVHDTPGWGISSVPPFQANIHKRKIYTQAQNKIINFQFWFFHWGKNKFLCGRSWKSSVQGGHGVVFGEIFDKNSTFIFLTEILYNRGL